MMSAPEWKCAVICLGVLVTMGFHLSAHFMKKLGTVWCVSCTEVAEENIIIFLNTLVPGPNYRTY